MKLVEHMMLQFLTSAQQSLIAATTPGTPEAEFRWNTERSVLAGMCAYLLDALYTNDQGEADEVAAALQEHCADGEPLADWVTEDARVRAQALRDFAESMRVLAEDAPADEPAKWPWSGYALAAVKAEEHAGKSCSSLAEDLARVRGQVAEELARIVESLCPSRDERHAGQHCDFADAAAVIREHSGKGFPRTDTPDHPEPQEGRTGA